ncbi:hypothetical protein SSX86_027859 [Deinandra increscens subsp. villosa]|uniref:J domain-containing protein n=1 Tax=Deinandra increscens subsp. villosa TaxID=3103831 RepID=A0AAP0CD43_9ASTR
MTSVKRCKNSEEAENVIIIDLDNDSFGDVNMNIPKSSAKKPRGSKGLGSDKNFPQKAYIYIDDDDEIHKNHNSGTYEKKNFPPMKLSKSKRMYPGRGTTNCYVLNTQLDEKKDDSKSIIHEKEGQSAGATEDASIEGRIVDEKEEIKDTVELQASTRGGIAEEAQQQRRLLKRKKAEKQRLLDIKKRQKQRVEEIRESQKQDEENMNKKEMYRIEVQQDLKKLEMKCHDMASLLCGLGIFINSPFATSDQVHTAYKRALLSFHPDRAAGCNMRQQVEAEEKFKLISRMKEKVNNIPSLK